MRVLEGRFGESPQGVWLLEVANECLHELDESTSGVDLNLLVHKCRAEPKNAQVAMQWLAEELRRDLGGRPVSEASGHSSTYRLLAGALLIAYHTARHIDGGWPLDTYPSELQPILQRYPEIAECAAKVLGDSQG